MCILLYSSFLFLSIPQEVTFGVILHLYQSLEGSVGEEFRKKRDIRKEFRHMRETLIQNRVIAKEAGDKQSRYKTESNKRNIKGNHNEERNGTKEGPSRVAEK